MADERQEQRVEAYTITRQRNVLFDALNQLGYRNYRVDDRGVLFADDITDSAGNPTTIDQDALDAKMLEINSFIDSTRYARKRSGQYPEVGDQLDDLFKQGAFSAEMAAKIQAVKDANPKPE